MSVHIGGLIRMISNKLRRKTENLKFAGGRETYSIEALMHGGKAL